MNPKEYAKDLHKRFTEVNVPYNDDTSGTIEDGDMGWEAAKQCALILTAEVVSHLVTEVAHPHKMVYWQEVKQEIEKL